MFIQRQNELHTAVMSEFPALFTGKPDAASSFNAYKEVEPMFYRENISGR
jgi:hypothetical protein